MSDVSLTFINGSETDCCILRQLPGKAGAMMDVIETTAPALP